MKCTLSGAISSDRVLEERVHRASRILEEVIGSTAEPVSAEWSLVRDASNRPLVLLALADFTGRVEARFAPEELAHEARLYAKFYKVWGDLLQARSHRQLDQLSG